MRIFYLSHREYDPIKEAIEFDSNFEELVKSILVYNYSKKGNDACYILFSNNEKVYKLIIENGGKETDTSDLYIKNLLNTNFHDRNLCYGNELLLETLK